MVLHHTSTVRPIVCMQVYARRYPGKNCPLQSLTVHYHLLLHVFCHQSLITETCPWPHPFKVIDCLAYDETFFWSHFHIFRILQWQYDPQVTLTAFVIFFPFLDFSMSLNSTDDTVQNYRLSFMDLWKQDFLWISELAKIFFFVFDPIFMNEHFLTYGTGRMAFYGIIGALIMSFTILMNARWIMHMAFIMFKQGNLHSYLKEEFGLNPSVVDLVVALWMLVWPEIQ